jgi:uncharacterized protein YfaP (DUF2135 family)
MRIKAKRPHVASIRVQLNVHAMTDAGEADGAFIRPDVLAEFGLKPVHVVSVKGFDLQDCLTKLARWLGERPK